MSAYVFCPEEPELHINIGGGMHNFKNGRLVFEDENAAAVVDFRKMHPRFLVASDPKDIGMELYERVMRSMARRADASNPTQIVNDAKYAIALMMRTGDDDVMPMPSDLKRDMDIIAKQMPTTVAGDASSLDYGEARKEAADEAAIEAGASEGTPDEVKTEDDLPENFSPPEEEDEESESEPQERWPMPGANSEVEDNVATGGNA